MYKQPCQRRWPSQMPDCPGLTLRISSPQPGIRSCPGARHLTTGTPEKQTINNYKN